MRNEIIIQNKGFTRFINVLTDVGMKPKTYTPIGLISLPISIAIGILLYQKEIISKASLLAIIVSLSFAITLLILLLLSIRRFYHIKEYVRITPYEIENQFKGNNQRIDKKEIAHIYVVFQRMIIRNQAGDISEDLEFTGDYAALYDALKEMDYPVTKQMNYPDDYEEKDYTPEEIARMAEGDIVRRGKDWSRGNF